MSSARSKAGTTGECERGVAGRVPTEENPLGEFGAAGKHRVVADLLAAADPSGGGR